MLVIYLFIFGGNIQEDAFIARTEETVLSWHSDTRRLNERKYRKGRWKRNLHSIPRRTDREAYKKKPLTIFWRLRTKQGTHCSAVYWRYLYAKPIWRPRSVHRYISLWMERQRFIDTYETLTFVFYLYRVRALLFPLRMGILRNKQQPIVSSSPLLFIKTTERPGTFEILSIISSSLSISTISTYL